MAIVNGKCIETKFTCKKCGKNDMSPNYTEGDGGTCVKGWKCNACGKIAYPVKDLLNKFTYERKVKYNNLNK